MKSSRHNPHVLGVDEHGERLSKRQFGAPEQFTLFSTDVNLATVGSTDGDVTSTE